jgi:transposase
LPTTGRPEADLILTDEERDQLVRWELRATSAQALALRSRIVLTCAEGLSGKDVAVRLGVTQATVGKRRRRFVEHRLAGLTDEPRPGRPATITVDQVEDVVVATLESTPGNATHRSRAKMAQRDAKVHHCLPGSNVCSILLDLKRVPRPAGRARPRTTTTVRSAWMGP